ncbi:Calreticulin [Orchesella cincta]|uniref:Calreticulin n=1 Tax=Orchesella cincta TaxID=48709 RepID=A0A1D2MGV1_ORCCI|nr:Calreticulin [Orchesella cincta]
MNSKMFFSIFGGLVLLVSVNSLLFLESVDYDDIFDYQSSVLSRQPRGSSSRQNHNRKGSNKKDENESESVEDTTPDPDDDSNTSEGDSFYNQNHGHKGNRKPTKPKPNKHNANRRIIVDEQFSHRNWTSEWIPAKNIGNGTKVYNKFSRVSARKSNHSRPNYGLITNNKGGEFYLIAKTFPPFNNKNETLVIQFSVQFQSKAHCQLAFLRLYDCQFSTDDFGTHTPYVMQVGPQICGTTRVSRLSAEFQEPGRSSIRAVDKDVEPVNNTSVNMYALALEADGTYHVIMNANATQNGTLKDEFPNYKGYTSICAVGLCVWHSVLDKYFKGQIIVDDVLVVNDMDYAERQRNQVLNLYSE